MYHIKRRNTYQLNAKFYYHKALIGRFLFQEMLSLLWWAGASLILLGLLLIQRDNPSTLETPANLKEKPD